MRGLALASAIAAAGCHGGGIPEIGPSEPLLIRPAAEPEAKPQPPPNPGDYEWPQATRSPQADPREVPLLTDCGPRDAALDTVAQRYARHVVRNESLDAAELVFALRAAGSPYVRPRAWSIEGEQSFEDSRFRLARWLSNRNAHGVRRCGSARVGEVVAVVTADALADLDPLPIRARAGRWIELESTLLVAATHAKLVVLGPTGPPKTVPTTLDGERVRATFSADRPGRWSVQLLLTTEAGPLPALEALIHVGTTPPTAFELAKAPGESIQVSGDPATDLFSMLSAARKKEGLGILVRRPKLDLLAAEHATAMSWRRLVAHDVGGGDPHARLEQAGVAHRAVGENVAHAQSLLRAHRALWASPSHRGNLLDARFDSVGVGVFEADDDAVWVTQIFTDD